MTGQSEAEDRPQRDAFPLRVIDAATQGLNVAGSCLILALMVLIGLDVIGRNLFGKPLSGVPEIVSLSIVAIVFLQIPQALKMGRMTRTEAFEGWIEHLSPTGARLLRSLFDLLGIAVVGIIVWTTWPLFVRAWERNDFVGAIGEFTAPTWPVKLTIVIGGTVLILQFAIQIIKRHASRP